MWGELREDEVLGETEDGQVMVVRGCAPHEIVPVDDYHAWCAKCGCELILC